MNVMIALAEPDLVGRLKQANPDLAGRCFENCVIAVVGLAETWRLEYVLGFLTPPGYDTVAHAWLREEREGAAVYLDPTLQDTSSLWSRRRLDFIYDERYRFTRDELLMWFRAKYPDRKFSSFGLPQGAIQGPRIDSDGLVK